MERLERVADKHKVMFAVGFYGVYLALFYITFYSIYQHSHVVAAFFALSLAMGVALVREKGYFYTLVRFLAVPTIGAVVLARSSLWTYTFFSNYSQLLRFDKPLPMWEPLKRADDWWIVAVIGLGFYVFYRAVEQWPRETGKSTKGVTAISAGTQIVIVTGIAYPTPFTVGISMLLAGILVICMVRELSWTALAFLTMAPFYSLTNEMGATLVFLVSAVIVFIAATVFPVPNKRSGFVYGVGFLMAFAPLCYLADSSTVLLVVAAVLVSGLAVFLRYKPLFVGSVAVEHAVLAVGVWMFAMALPNENWSLVVIGTLLTFPLLLTVVRDRHHPIRLYVKLVLLWMVYLVVLPVLPFYAGNFTPLYHGTVLISVYLLCDYFWSRRKVASCTP